MYCKNSVGRVLLASALCLITLLCGTISHAASKCPKQKSFGSPEEAEKALIQAVKVNNNKALLRILGPGSKAILYSGDKAADKAGRERFLKAYEQKNKLEQKAPGCMVLNIGPEDWPLPIPIVKKGNAWIFDTEAGKEEILNRRIGRNELQVIDTMHAYVDAQEEYAEMGRQKSCTPEFAQKFVSTSGMHDGLYWEPASGQGPSPLGPFIAKAALSSREEEEDVAALSPFHGYYYRILKRQGEHAPGGAYDYVVNGKMILGFALIAYPAKYANSGIMTFIVNQQGIVYEKDLGQDTEKVAKSIKNFDPDDSWKKVSEVK